jgi:DNA-binding NtrC family response regulator
MVLIVDDDIAVQTSLSLLFRQAGLASDCASGPADGLKILEKNKPEAVILDLNYSNDTSGKEGLEFLNDIRKILPSVPVILITAWASIELAVKGMKNGAFDFISKPWDNNDLLATVSTAIELNRETPVKHSLKRAELDKKFDFTGIIGEGQKMISVLGTIGRVCKTDAPVLILGDSGTGKELIAEAIHKNSNRKDAPFVKVNLGGISSGLFESEMFGHRKGAFTDAFSDRKGRFEMAGKGTIFLDEIGDLDFNLQVKLLRVLQDKTYQLLGESVTRRIDVRVICATNRNLKAMVKEGTFREDLLYRINLITIELPPLLERKEDIPSLVQYFLKNLGTSYNAGEIAVDNNTLKWLQNLTYPGNIRELKNLVERSWLLAGKDVLTIADFQNAPEQSMVDSPFDLFPASGKMTLEEMEKEAILKTMERFGNNLSKTAKSLGLSRGALYRRLNKYNIRFNSEQWD